MWLKGTFDVAKGACKVEPPTVYSLGKHLQDFMAFDFVCCEFTVFWFGSPTMKEKVFTVVWPIIFL